MMELKCVRIWRVIIYGLALFLTGFLLFHNFAPSVLQPYSSKMLHRKHVLNKYVSVGEPRILFWTKFYGADFVPSLTVYKEAIRDLNNCPFQNCRLTNDRNLLNESDAVIICITDFVGMHDLPKSRSSDQYFIFYALESPVHVLFNISPLNQYFNLTFTYRVDSDVVSDSYFQHFHPTLLNNREDFLDLWMKKDKFGLALVSNCNPPSHRAVYLQELSKFFPLDIYGKCGLDCDQECDSLVVQYKFYFAFENSICKDYVTEKIHRAFNHGTIPVVYGGADYSKLFPSMSFINALDFDNPGELAKYLVFVAHNWTAYEQYFKWRYSADQLQLPSFIQSQKLSWCKLCGMLNEKERTTKLVTNLTRWWKVDSKCAMPEVDLKSSPLRWIRNPLVL